MDTYEAKQMGLIEIFQNTKRLEGVAEASFNPRIEEVRVEFKNGKTATVFVHGDVYLIWYRRGQGAKRFEKRYQNPRSAERIFQKLAA